MSTTSSSPIEVEKAGAIVPVSYILAVLMPLVGFILGIVVVTRPNKATSKHGAWVIVLSVVAFIVCFAIVLSSMAHSVNTYNGY